MPSFALPQQDWKQVDLSKENVISLTAHTKYNLTSGTAFITHSVGAIENGGDNQQIVLNVGLDAYLSADFKFDANLESSQMLKTGQGTLIFTSIIGSNNGVTNGLYNYTGLFAVKAGTVIIDNAALNGAQFSLEQET